ncbi:MAG: phosphopantothenoylcysteine decarboxylase, partial [Myxococcota bacterium]
VLLVAGPVQLPTPPGVDRVDVQTTAEMRDAVFEGLARATIVIKAAAVADYRAELPATQKMRRGQDPVTIRLVPNPDILAEVSSRKGNRTVVGFAAETESVLESAALKLERKGCDLIVANDVSRTDLGFDVDRNEVWIVGPARGDVTHVPPAAKHDVAARILDRIREIRPS